eukprot:CAMPEP_0118666104 /NCGR_PEP_ID=MMETSP0785-20121206/19017_1 /TAXON_ID=91992 /ORGANISM="Bolidomonas pacifica, Strain CCMP 1866" /LENGTH=235 /DNA_ID=CAMNT_0006560353 /DNA_START=404 /DNA_END=1108 /DNA_ORIENTATION=-
MREVNGKGTVQIMIPWLGDEHDQRMLFKALYTNNTSLNQTSNCMYAPQPHDPYQLPQQYTQQLNSKDEEENEGGNEGEYTSPNSSNTVFPTTHHQKVYIKNWLHSNSIPPSIIQSLKIHFYPSRYHPGHHSIFSISDTISQALSVNCGITLENVTNETKGDVIILEEPEHLNWYRIPSQTHKSFRTAFAYSIGIIHTNYIAYISQHYARFFGARVGVKAVSEALVKANCDVVVKL